MAILEQIRDGQWHEVRRLLEQTPEGQIPKGIRDKVKLVLAANHNRSIQKQVEELQALIPQAIEEDVRQVRQRSVT